MGDELRCEVCGKDFDFGDRFLSAWLLRYDETGNEVKRDQVYVCRHVHDIESNNDEILTTENLLNARLRGNGFLDRYKPYSIEFRIWKILPEGRGAMKDGKLMMKEFCEVCEKELHETDDFKKVEWVFLIEKKEVVRRESFVCTVHEANFRVTACCRKVRPFRDGAPSL